jgi:hypothetical protein
VRKVSEKFGTLHESLTAEREQDRKIQNFSVTEENQDSENSYCAFFGLVPFLQLAIHIDRNFVICTEDLVSLQQ